MGGAKEQVQKVLSQCTAEGVKLPTDDKAAKLSIGRALASTKTEEGEFDIEATMKELKEQFGCNTPLKKKRKKIDSEEVESEASPSKKKQKPLATNPKNQALADVLQDLCGEEFKHEEKFKGMNLSKAAKSVREHEETITSGKQAQKLKGIGKSTALKIDQFLEEGKIDRLEEYRSGAMS